jgi:hypothetical protein
MKLGIEVRVTIVGDLIDEVYDPDERPFARMVVEGKPSGEQMRALAETLYDRFLEHVETGADIDMHGPGRFENGRIVPT